VPSLALFLAVLLAEREGLWAILLAYLLLTLLFFVALRLRIDRHTLVELISIGAMALSGPTARFVSRGDWDAAGWGVLTVSFTYFAHSIWVVRMWMAARESRAARLSFREKWSLGLPVFYVTVEMAVLLVLLSTLIAIPPVAWLALSVAPLRWLAQMSLLSGSTKLKTVGQYELIAASIFVVLAGVAYLEAGSATQ
jgi:hypothetical protein